MKLTPFRRSVLQHIADNGAVPIYFTAEPARRASVNAMRADGLWETRPGRGGNRTYLTAKGRAVLAGKCPCGCGSKAR